MNRKNLIFSLISMAFLMSPGVAAAFAGGDGSENNPFQIATPQHLDDIRNDLGAYYVLIADIDLDVAPFNVSPGWVPIGDSVTRFTGQLDGAGFEIRNLFIDRPAEDNVGFFSYTETGAATPGATVMNLDLVNADVTGDFRTGVLAAHAQNGIYIDNVSVSGVLTTSAITGCLVGDARADSVIENSAGNCQINTDGSRSGGLVGELEGQAMIINSYATGDINSTSSRAGGLVGEMEDDAMIIDSFATGNITSTGTRIGGLVGNPENNTQIINSWASGDVTGSTRVGGLAGELEQFSSVFQSFATGNVTGDDRVGGLVGRAENDSSISQSYATGSATGNDQVGGLVGILEDRATIEDSYAWGSASGGDRVGGLVGYAEADTAISTSYATGAVSGGNDLGGLVGSIDMGATITNSYWDRDTTGQTTSAGQQDDHGLTTAEMLGFAAVTNMTGFNFNDIWVTVNNGYPVFEWQGLGAPVAPAVPVPFGSAWMLVVLALMLLLVAAPVVRSTGHRR